MGFGTGGYEYGGTFSAPEDHKFCQAVEQAPPTPPCNRQDRVVPVMGSVRCECPTCDPDA